MAQQLTFDLPIRVAMGRDDFLVAPCNETAVAMIDRWPNWAGHCLVLWGPEGSGKTHLCRVWATMSGATTVGPEGWDEGLALVRQGRPVCLDINNEIGDQETLLHLFNWARENQADILMTGRLAPVDWPLTLPDLSSRLRAASQARLGRPDDPLLAALMVKMFHDRQISVGRDVLEFLLRRVERSYAGINDVVARLDGAALRERRAITVPFVKGVLGY